MGIAVKYGSLEAGSAPDILMSQVGDDVRLPYSKSIRNLLQEVDSLKRQLAKNIEGALSNLEKAEVVEKKSAECLEQAKVFKKRAKKLKWTTWAKANKIELAGAAIVGSGGFIAGFMAGGPTGAAVLTGMSCVACAQLIEASIGALLFVAGFVGARSVFETWFWSQKHVIL
jgi:preprotein translocase subunit Sss1